MHLPLVLGMTNPLFTPFKCKGLELPNRIVMAPMTRSFSPGGVPGQNVIDYYSRRAAADVGLIITEGTPPDRAGATGTPNVPNFYKKDALEGWGNVLKSVHGAGGRIAPQIWHEGLMRKPGTGPNPDAPSDSPSGITHRGKQVAKASSDSDIADMIMSYGRAAAQASSMGFDAMEIHGAHGYLIDEFFWDVMNKREDKYGGDFLERTRFAHDVISEVKKHMREDMPLILRWSQWKQQDYTAKLAKTPYELEAFIGLLADAGVDIFHCSTRRFWEAEFGGSDLNLAGWVKKLSGKPTIVVGSVGLSGDFVNALVKAETSQPANLDGLLERMDRGEFDLVAVGRALLKDPEWASKIKDGRHDELLEYKPEDMGVLF